MKMKTLFLTFSLVFCTLISGSGRAQDMIGANCRWYLAGISQIHNPPLPGVLQFTSFIEVKDPGNYSDKMTVIVGPNHRLIEVPIVKTEKNSEGDDLLTFGPNSMNLSSVTFQIKTNEDHSHSGILKFGPDSEIPQLVGICNFGDCAFPELNKSLASHGS
jgi:hypothetical protein